METTRHPEMAGVVPVLTFGGMMSGGGGMTNWSTYIPYPDPDAIARALARGEVTDRLRDRNHEVEQDASRQMPLGLCFRAAGECQYSYQCERCPYLRLDAAELPRLRAIEAETLARLVQVAGEGSEGEVEWLAETVRRIAEKRARAEQAAVA